jgi:hypothetical protein
MKKFYIKERYNPQLGIRYYACGQLSKRDAKLMEKTLFGNNIMLEFPDRKSYDEALDRFRKAGSLR